MFITKESQDREEIKFWKRAIKILRAGYGKPCKNYVEACIQCQAGKTIEFIKSHIKILEN